MRRRPRLGLGHVVGIELGIVAELIDGQRLVVQHRGQGAVDAVDGAMVVGPMGIFRRRCYVLDGDRLEELKL